MVIATADFPGRNGWYEQTGYIASEHAALDDNGDGSASRLPLSPDSEDGVVAATIYIEGAGAQVANGVYTEAIAAVEAWKTQKSTVEVEEYWATLEEFLLKAARANPRRQKDSAASP